MKRVAIIGGVCAVALAGGAVAYAAIPNSSTHEYTACVANVNLFGRTVKMIDKQAGESCPSGYSEKTWNQAGVQGATGPTGATGPMGPAGDPASVPHGTLYGLYSIDDRQVVPAHTNSGDDPGGHFSIHCPVGQVLLGAYSWVQVGANPIGSVDAGSAYNSDNGAGGGPNGVQVMVWNHTATDGELRTVLNCAHES